jgi:hypothetical protein
MQTEVALPPFTSSLLYFHPIADSVAPPLLTKWIKFFYSFYVQVVNKKIWENSVGKWVRAKNCLPIFRIAKYEHYTYVHYVYFCIRDTPLMRFLRMGKKRFDFQICT